MKKEIVISKKTLVEFSILFIVILSFVITSFLLFGGSVKDAITKSSCKLIKGVYIEGERIGKGYCVNK